MAFEGNKANGKATEHTSEEFSEMKCMRLITSSKPAGIREKIISHSMAASHPIHR